MAIHSISVHPDRIRTIEDPNYPGMKTVYALVNVLDIPHKESNGKRELLLSMAPDPRVPHAKKRNAVTKDITRTLESWDGSFHLLNRGITISARAADYNNKTKLLELNLPEEDDRYGILDGGHTFGAIEAVLDRSHPSQDGAEDQFVRFEVLIGAEEYLGQIAQARNNSIQVKPFSLRNKSGDFDWLKKAVSPFDKSIRWSENDPQDFPVLELVQIMAACNPIQFGASNHPIEAYKNSGKCLEYLLDSDDKYGYRRLTPVAKDIWRLYDTIRSKWWELYNQPHPVTGKPGRAGRLAEVRGRKRGKASLMRYVTLAKQGDPKVDKHVEKGLAFPALAGFRALLKVGPDDKVQWTTDPFKFFDSNGALLIRTIMDASDSRDNNPHIVGRDATVYDLVYRMIESELTKVENQQLREQLAKQEAASLQK